MSPHHVKKRNGLRVFYYECTRKSRTCPVKRLPASDFEEWAWNQLNGLCQNPQVLHNALDHYEKSCAAGNSVEKARLQDLERQVRESKGKLEALKAYLATLLAQGTTPAASLNTELLKYERERDSRATELAMLRSNLRANSPVDPEAFLRALRHVLADGNASSRRKRAVIAALVKEIVVSASDITFELVAFTSGGASAWEGARRKNEWFAQPSRMAPRPGLEPGTL
ncbi:MAG: hypothetical protein KIS92_06505 [Planctomycetota bacterium]|nr:hypothetical protein [Planctomycetota bacterium]